MNQPRTTIDDVRAFYTALLNLVELGLVCVLPSPDLLDPFVQISGYCTPEQRASAIPLSELRRIFIEDQRAFLAPLN